MNDAELQQLWERRRDGELSEEERRAFDAHLAENPEVAEAWEAESRWLAALSHEEPVEPEDRRAFTDRTFRRWQRGGTPRPILRIAGWSAAAAAVLIAAAAVAIRSTGEPAAPHAPVAGDVGSPGPEQPTDPLSVLVARAARQIETEPAEVRHAVERARSLLDPQRIVDALERPAGTLPGPFDRGAEPAEREQQG